MTMPTLRTVIRLITNLLDDGQVQSNLTHGMWFGAGFGAGIGVGIGVGMVIGYLIPNRRQEVRVYNINSN